MSDKAQCVSVTSKLSWADRLIIISLLALGGFSWLPDSYFRMVSWPWVLLWQGAFGIVMAICLWRLRRFDQPLYRLGFGFDWLIIGLLGCLVISSTVSSFPLLALQNSLLVTCYVMLLYGLRNSRLRPLQLCQGVVWVGAIAAIVSLVMWQPTPDMWLSDNFYDAIRNRFPLGHHNFTGGYFLLVLPVAAGLAWLHIGWRRWGYGVLSVTIAIALYASGSRGAWLGCVVLLVIALASGIVQSRGKARLGTLAVAGVAICLILALLGSNPRIRSLAGFWLSPDAASSSVVIDGPTLDRVFMAQASLNILKDRPLGLGPGNLGRVYERYRPLAAGAGLTQVQQLHNTPLQIVVEVGVGGAILYLSLLICLVRLIYQLQSLSAWQERRLSLAVAMGLLGYGVSSLSDYQLENIPIAATLTVLLSSITQLGSTLASSVLPQKTRRWGSLLLFMLVALISQFWLRSTLSLWMTHQGFASINRGNLMQADGKFYTAATLTPWDPTPSALGAQQLTELAKNTSDDEQDILREEAIELYRQALRTAPNDIWFNQNLAVLAWQTGDIATAHNAIAKVVQLSPRSKNHSYYLLGLTYQQMGNAEAAVEAFALECLMNPDVLLFESWQQELSALRAAVFERVLEHCQTLFSDLVSKQPLRDSLKTHMDTLRWWSDQGPISTDGQRLLIQALLTMEHTPDQAISLLDRCIAETPSDASECRLLKAWLQPEYLSEYLRTAGLEPAEQEALRSHIATHRDLKQWLQSTTVPVSEKQRVALALLYRSYYAQQISSILVPDNLRIFSLPTSLKLFTLPWPREFPPLDNLVETVRAEALGLPHPTYNNFEFAVPEEFVPS